MKLDIFVSLDKLERGFLEFKAYLKVVCHLTPKGCRHIHFFLFSKGYMSQVICRLTSGGRLIVTAPKSSSRPVREVPILKSG